MVAIDAQNWLTTKVNDWKNAKQIYGTKDGKRSLDEKDREFLTGDLVVENLNELEELNLYDVRELNKVVIKNCSKLKQVNLLQSGVKQLEVGPGLDQIKELSFGFEIDPTRRPVARKLDQVDLSKVTSLEALRCVGVQETKLIGFEKLTQLEWFSGAEKVKIPNKEFSKWKDKLNTITGPSGLDLLKGGSGLDKDEVDRAKIDDYKNRPTKGELDKELNKIKNLLGISVNNPLPNDWETKLVKKTDLEAANRKVKEYEDGLKTDLGLNDSTLPGWRNEIAKLKSKPTGTTLSPADQHKINNFDRLKVHAENQEATIVWAKEELTRAGRLSQELKANIEELGKFRI